jgi:uncharacterized protein YjdB
MTRRLLSLIFPGWAGAYAQPVKGMHATRFAGLLLATLCTLGLGQAKAQTHCSPVYSGSSGNCFGGYGVQIYSFHISGEAGSAINEGSLACSVPQYFDRTSLGALATLHSGQSYDASINLGSAFSQYYAIWVDFNDDGVFSATEMITTPADVYGYGTFTVTIPVAANLGNHTLRVRSFIDYYITEGYIAIDPCSDGAYGEARDYTVQVTAPISVASVPAICAGTSSTLNASGADTYSWAPATGLDATTGASVVATPSVTTTYTVTGTTIYGTGTATVTVTVHNDITPIAGNTALNSAIPAQLTNEMTGGTWTSANGSVAAVSTSGLVTAVSAGNTTISYTVVGCPSVATTNVTVTNVNAALNFDGSDDRIDGTNGALPQGSSDRTIEAWVNVSNYSGSKVIFNWGTFSVNERSGLVMSGDHLYFVGESNDVGAALAVVPLNTWTHVAVTTSGQSVQFYINGVFVQAGTLPSMPNTIGGSWSISNTNDDAATREPFSGSIDEIRVWNTVRSASEISANMSCDVAQQPGLVAYYRFDQGTTGADNTALVTTSDYSGNNACGTLSNFALNGTTSNYVSGAVGSCNNISLAPDITGTASVLAGGTSSLSSTTPNGTWISGDASIATVNASTGEVAGVAVGNAVITYTVCGGAMATTNVTVTAPVAATGLNFDGVDDNVSLGSSITDLNTGDFTIEMWVKTTTPNAGLFTCQNSDTYWQMGERCFYLDASGFPTFVGNWSGYIFSTMSVTDGNWHHLAVTRNNAAGIAKIYIDGVDQTSPSTSYFAYVGNVGTFYLGKPNYGECSNFFNGSMDEVRIWNRALCQSELTNNMNCELTGTPNGLAAYYKFNQGYAFVHNDSVTSVTDASGNSYTGTLSNFALSGNSSNWVTGNISGTTCAAFVQNITGNTPVCPGSSLSLSSATANGTWNSSNASVATVDATTGIVTAIASGNANITYTVCGGAITSAVVTVNQLPAAMSGATAVCMSASATLSNATTGGSWATADAGIATIDASGVVTPVAAGNTTVSYTLPTGCYTTSALVVNPLPAAITGTTGMCAGNTTSLTSATTGGGWSSANNAIVNVNTEGIVTSRNTAGITTISYTIPATGCYVTSTVNNMVAAISGSQGICSGLTATVADATTGGAWSSTNTTLAAIGTNGVITAGAGGGAATISYTAAGCYRTSPFTVSTTPGAITGTPVVCSGYSTTLYNASPGGAWSPTPTGAISSVTAGGVVTGANAGTSMISYRLSPTCYATVVFTVNPLPYAISGIARVCPGTTTSLGSITTGGTWSSSDPTLATVSSSGLVSGIATGSPIITFTAGGCFRTIAVTVNPNPPVITGGTLINVGSTSVLSETATNGAGWSSSNTAVATVGGGTSGTVSGISVGNAIITFMTNTGCYATTSVTVAMLSAISGPTKTCLATPATYTCASPGGVWSVSNPSVATIDPALGTLTGISQGTLIVSYTQGPLYKTLAVTVSLLPTPVTGSQVMCVGTSSAIVSNGSSGTWVSSNTAVASFPNTATGTMNGIGVGTANVTFTAQVSGCLTTAVVTVNPALAANTGTANACVGTSTTLANSQAAGTWSSSLPAVASVDAATGVVTAIGAGTATITYALSPNCRVTTAYTSKALPNAIAGTSSVCMPVTATLTSTTTGGTWSSSDATIAAVGSAINSTYGVVTGALSGAVTITYTIPGTGCYRTAAVTVASGLNPGTISSSSGFALRTVSIPHTATLSSTGAAGGAWSSSNSAIASVDPVTGIVTGVAAGSATITYSVTGACTNTATHAITVAAGRDGGNAPVENVSVDLYPNPTTGTFTVTASQQGTLRIFTLDGRELANHNVAAGATTLSMPSGAASGIYMCRFTTEDGSNVVFRLVFEN